MEDSKKEIEKDTKKIVRIDKNHNRKCAAGNGCIYGLGFIGAAVFFIGEATTFGAGVIGFLKALVWPAFMVYEAFKFLIS